MSRLYKAFSSRLIEICDIQLIGKKVYFLLERGDGQVVSVLSFYSNAPSLNPCWSLLIFVGPWWWSSCQRALLLLRRSKFEFPLKSTYFCWTVVMVKLSACSPSTPMLWVRIPTEVYLFLLDRGEGQVVSVLSFYSNAPSSNPRWSLHIFVGPLWWSSCQHALLLLRRSEFESLLKSTYFSVINWVWKEWK